VELLFGYAGFSADGRVDVDSKRTADHQGDFELGEFLEFHRNGARCGTVHVEAGGMAEIFGIEGADAQAERNAMEAAFGEEEEQARD
jgi:hypothetical protein